MPGTGAVSVTGASLRGAFLFAVLWGCGSGSAATVAISTTEAGAGREAAGEQEASGEQDAGDAPNDTPSAGAGGLLRGTVVSLYTQRPLAARKVWIGAATTTTDALGRFELPGVADTYDVIVAEPDSTTITVYRGLTRRDPLLVHAGAPTWSHRATVRGDVSGGGNYPLASSDLVAVNFFSPQADQFSVLGGARGSTLELGPSYGPIPLIWDGPGAILGKLVAFGTFRDAQMHPSSWFVQQPLMLADGQSARVNLALASVATTIHLSGRIDLPPNSQLVEKRVSYRWPVANARLGLPVTQSHVFDDDVPALDDSGIELCVGAVGKPGTSLAERCGRSLDPIGFAVTLQAPPTFSSPAINAVSADDAAPPIVKIAKDAPFAWTSFDRGMYLLELDSVPFSATQPQIFLFTAETSTVWPNLEVVGIAFPVASSYRCSVAGLGPYASMDDAAGPDGLGAPFPSETQRSYSPAFNAATVP